MTKSDKWSHDVTIRPPATFPPEGIFTKKAKEIYLAMRRPDVSPNGLGSAIQMTQFFVNRAGSKMEANQKKEVLKAVKMLQIELEFLNQADDCVLWKEPRPIHPAPIKRVGGK